MLRLGHIIYSNCFPPHAGIITGNVPFPHQLFEGIPTALNRLLSDGAIDVSPSSSIEYAMHPGRYVILPDLSISAAGRVRSIILQSRVPIGELDQRTVALTAASATSVVLLRILLDKKYSIRPRYVSFGQGRDDPFTVADAALFIGDLALTLPKSTEDAYYYDLGILWHEFTGLPFVFALWQVNYQKVMDAELADLYDILILSRDYGVSHVDALARDHAKRFGVPADLLADYWNSMSYRLGDAEKQGLLAFYHYAAEIGAIQPITELRIWERK